MHGSIGTSCAVADVRGNSARSGRPRSPSTRNGTARRCCSGLPPENVRVIFTRGSGCYGINGADTVSYDAALLSQAVDRPVRVQLMRKDEMAWENYGFAFVIDQRAGSNADGDIIAWDYEGWSPALGNRPGNEAPGNVVTGFLAGFQPAAFVPRTPAPDPATGSTTATLAPSYVAGCVGGRVPGFRHHQERARALASPARSRSGRDRCDRPSASRTPLPTSRSWTRSRHTRKPIRSPIGCVI